MFSVVFACTQNHGLLSKKILENVNKFNLKVLKAPGEYLHYR